MESDLISKESTEEGGLKKALRLAIGLELLRMNILANSNTRKE
jgi:hypothetical protein